MFNLITILDGVLYILVRRNTSVSIATRHGLDGQGIESRCGARLPAHVHTAPEAPRSLLCNAYQIFPGVKEPGRGVDHPLTSSAEVEERIELYIYSPCVP